MGNLARCNKDVLIASPIYGENYKCEITVSAEDLLHWVVDHHTNALGGSALKASEEALLSWLRGADPSGKPASYIPPFAFLTLDPLDHRVLNLVVDGKAKVFCFECQSVVADVQMKKSDEKRKGNWVCWKKNFICPEGHQLYFSEYAMHFYNGQRSSHSIERRSSRSYPVAQFLRRFPVFRKLTSLFGAELS